jgi:hypothetical protein
MPVRTSEVPSWDMTTKELQVSAGTLPSRATRWKQAWLWPWTPPLRQPLEPTPYSDLGRRRAGREVLEAGPDGELPVERDDAAAARTLDQHLRVVAGNLP